MIVKHEHRRTRVSEEECMCMPPLNTNIDRRAYSYPGPDTWNKLNKSVKAIKTRSAFKNQYLHELMRDVNHPG